MRFEIAQRFAGSLESVEEALIAPAFLARLATLPKLGRPELLDQHHDGAITIQRVRYTFAGDLSAAVRAVIDPQRLTWVEVSTIDRTRHHTMFEIQPDHYSNLLKCRGTFALQGAADGCARTATGDVVVPMPLVGRRVEAAIVSGLREHAELEATVMDDWLAGAGPTLS